ncbi:MAG TPA: DcaP family trimeric outer membrane transporter, partial [Candidatus Polarisedimenticolaceae bacterium]
LIPDLVGRAVWKVKDIGHLQVAGVLRQIRGEWALDPAVRQSTFAWGASVSGVVPFHYFDLTDRLIFQINVGKGNARYVNDLNSLGGQDAVFDDATGRLEPLRVTGGYIDFEHQWKRWETTRVMKLRSSVIWSYVEVDNLTFQPDDAYHRTNRWSANLVFSPIERINFGIEYVYGTRTNKNGNRGKSSQVQVVGIFRF